MAETSAASLGGISVTLGINSGAFVTGLQAAERGLDSAAKVAEDFAQIIAKTSTPIEALVMEMDRLKALEPFAQTSIQAQALAREMENLSTKFGAIFDQATRGPLDEAHKAVRKFRREVEGVSTEEAKSQLDALNKMTGRSAQFMLNFGRTLQDMPFGLTAIANNIPELINQFGQISEAAKAAGGNTSVMGTILGSLKGPMLGIVAIGFASALYEMVKNTDAFKAATRALNDMMRELTTTAEDSRKALADFGRALATEDIKKNHKTLDDLKDILKDVNQEILRMKFGDQFASQTAKMAVEMTRMKLLAEQGARERRQIQSDQIRQEAKQARAEAQLLMPKSQVDYLNPFTAARAIENRQQAADLLDKADQLDDKAGILEDITKNRLRVEQDIESQYNKQKATLDEIIAKEKELIDLKTDDKAAKQAAKEAKEREKAAAREKAEREKQTEKAADLMIGFSDFIDKQAADLEKMGITNRAQEGVALAVGAGIFEPLAAVLRKNIDPLTGAIIDSGMRLRTTTDDLNVTIEALGKKIEAFTREALANIAERGIGAAASGDIFSSGLGGAIGGVIGGFFGAPQIGAAIGGAVSPAVDELAHTLGVVDPLMKAFSDVISILTPVLQSLKPIFSALSDVITPLVKPLQDILAFFALPLLVVGRLLQMLVPVVGFLGEVIGLATTGLMDFVKMIDQFLVNIVNGFVNAFNYLIIWINAALSFFGIDARMDLLKTTESVFLSNEELADATEDNTEAVKELSRQINNLPAFYKLGGALSSATVAGGGPALGIMRGGEVMIGTVNVSTNANNMAQLTEDIRRAAREKQRLQGRTIADNIGTVASTGVF